SIEDRIVNIYQPYVRPIVRGKEKAKVEFGSKIGVSQCNGYARINTLNWNAYNESTDLKKQVEDFNQTNGHYPEVVIVDKIYGTRENRSWLKERGIRFSGKPLGRPKKESLSPYQKRKQKIEQGLRNEIEGKFGQGKNAYDLNRVRTRTAKTSESWIACIVFVMNLIKHSKDFLFSIGNELRNRLDKIVFGYFANPMVILLPVKC
ncbi:transposase, partial [bacterium]|nr:transposase [bacterium]